MQFTHHLNEIGKDEVRIAGGLAIVVQQVANNGVPIPPGDDSWDRENDLPPQAFDLWTRTNVGENLPFPVTPLTETNFAVLFKLDEANAKPGSKPVQGMRRIYGRM